MPVVILMPVNTSRREGFRLSAIGFRLSAYRWLYSRTRETSDCQTSDILYSRQQEGSGAFGARVLSFVCFAPNDGFRPQSGLVSREALPMAVKTFTTGLAPDGNAPLLMLTHHLSPGGGTFLAA